MAIKLYRNQLIVVQTPLNLELITNYTINLITKIKYYSQKLNAS